MSTSGAKDDPLEESGVLVNASSPPVSEKSSHNNEKPDEQPLKKLRGNHILALALRRMFKGPAPTLDHIVRFLSSGSGHDKFWMTTQYFTKIIVWIFAKRGLKSASERVRLLSGLVADYRIMIRLVGLAPMTQFIRYCEQTQAPTRTLQWLDRIMNLSMVCYYPLEHIYWLGAHRIIPISEKLVDDAGYWSCRFWAIWIALQFVHLGEEYRVIKSRRQKIYTQGKVDAAQMQQELDAVDADTKSWWIQLLINTCYFPLTMHWSIRGSTFPDVAVGCFGTVAALAQAYNVWHATA